MIFQFSSWYLQAELRCLSVNDTKINNEFWNRMFFNSNFGIYWKRYNNRARESWKSSSCINWSWRALRSLPFCQACQSMPDDSRSYSVKRQISKSKLQLEFCRYPPSLVIAYFSVREWVIPLISELSDNENASAFILALVVSFGFCLVLAVAIYVRDSTLFLFPPRKRHPFALSNHVSLGLWPFLKQSQRKWNSSFIQL